ncbi:hypothetical protein HY970_03320 [Candidatus Kaiserbacteria bacterium]|nr:hypothetical protein [Candidatus Kaiserbacteria bacterium]
MDSVSGIIELLMTIDIIAIPLGIIASVVLAIQARKAQDPTVKKARSSWAWRTTLWPLGILLILIVVYGLAILIRNTIQP